MEANKAAFEHLCFTYGLCVCRYMCCFLLQFHTYVGKKWVIFISIRFSLFLLGRLDSASVLKMNNYPIRGIWIKMWNLCCRCNPTHNPLISLHHSWKAHIPVHNYLIKLWEIWNITSIINTLQKLKFSVKRDKLLIKRGCVWNRKLRKSSFWSVSLELDQWWGVQKDEVWLCNRHRKQNYPSFPQTTWYHTADSQRRDRLLVVCVALTVTAESSDQWRKTRADELSEV